MGVLNSEVVLQNDSNGLNSDFGLETTIRKSEHMPRRKSAHIVQSFGKPADSA